MFDTSRRRFKFLRTRLEFPVGTALFVVFISGISTLRDNEVGIMHLTWNMDEIEE